VDTKHQPFGAKVGTAATALTMRVEFFQNRFINPENILVRMVDLLNVGEELG
jgi:hypothetical protein